MSKELFITDNELVELIGTLQIAQGDASALADQSHDPEELVAYKAHTRALRDWIKRLERLKKEATESEEEPPDLVMEQLHRSESPHYRALGEDEPYYREPDMEEEE